MVTSLELYKYDFYSVTRRPSIFSQKCYSISTEDVFQLATCIKVWYMIKCSGFKFSDNCCSTLTKKCLAYASVSVSHDSS